MPARSSTRPCKQSEYQEIIPEHQALQRPQHAISKSRSHSKFQSTKRTPEINFESSSRCLDPQWLQCSICLLCFLLSWKKFFQKALFSHRQLFYHINSFTIIFHHIHAFTSPTLPPPQLLHILKPPGVTNASRMYSLLICYSHELANV